MEKVDHVCDFAIAVSFKDIRTNLRPQPKPGWRPYYNQYIGYLDTSKKFENFQGYHQSPYYSCNGVWRFPRNIL